MCTLYARHDYVRPAAGWCTHNTPGTSGTLDCGVDDDAQSARFSLVPVPYFHIYIFNVSLVRTVYFLCFSRRRRADAFLDLMDFIHIPPPR